MERAESPHLRGSGATSAAAIGVAAGLFALVLRTPALLVAAAAGVWLVPLAWYAFAVPRRWLTLFFAALVLLPPLPGAGGVRVHVAVAFGAIGLLAGTARAGSWQPVWTAPCGWLNSALIAFVSALTVSLAFALLYSGAAVAAGSAARVLLFCLAVYVYFSASQGPDRASAEEAAGTARFLFAVALAAALFGCIDFIYQLPAPAGASAQFLWLDSGVYRRAQGLFYESGMLGNFCAFSLVMSVAAILQPRGRRILPQAAAYAGVPVFALAMLLSYSRSSVIAAGVACLMLAIVSRKNSSARGDSSSRSSSGTFRLWKTSGAVLVLVALLVVACLVMAYSLPEFAAGYWQRLAPGLQNLFERPDRVLSGRIETWRTIGGFIAAHPWQVFFGTGYKTLPDSRVLGTPTIADNMYLSTLVETGIPGFLSLLALNGAILAASWRAARRGSFYGKWMLCFWAGEMFQMLSADVLTYWRVLPLYFWVMAQAARSIDLHADSTD
jgi:O-antigen ligase